MHDPEKSLEELGERTILQHLRNRIPKGEGVGCGIGDDAAVVETQNLTLVTTDCLVEGSHFILEWAPPKLLGRKALTINLSDIAAMAGVPRYATVSLCLPRSLTLGVLDELYDGLLERAAEAGVSLVGGNLAATEGPIIIDVTLLGYGDRVLTRAGGFPGDRVVVTGGLGAAAEGLRLLRQGARLSADGEVTATGIWTSSSAPAVEHCLRAQLDPSPPLAFARSLAEHDLVHACMDLSDGLSSDLFALCRESGLTARLDPAALPIDAHMAGLERARGGNSRELALHGGEDYQLLMAVPPSALATLKDHALVWDLTLADLGEFMEGEPGVFLGDDPLDVEAHDHFFPRSPSSTSVALESGP